MASKPNPAEVQRLAWWPRVFPLCFGAFLGLALLKFCNPPVMEKFVVPPADGYEWAISTWPTSIGYGLLAGLALGGLLAARFQIRTLHWLMALPLVWLVWQFISSTQSVDVELTRVTLKYFVACVACFYLGRFCLNRDGVENSFLGPLAVAFVLMIAVGLNQHFGGLQETREFVLNQEQNHWRDLPADQTAEMMRAGLLIQTPEGYRADPRYLSRAQSSRISSTLFYPNSLAGAILLLLPPLLAWVWQARQRFTFGARSFLCGVLAVGAMACLYWSGSKGGWLLALVGGLVVLLNQDFSKRLKLILVLSVLLIGGAGFVWKYAGFFQRGATSVVARFDYWEAAWKTAVAKPIFGSGPGTFGVVYAAVKRPESEMARLTHNDYLQQASDSGFPGMAAYTAFILGLLWVGFPRWKSERSPVQLGIWVGLLAWSLQGLGEFTLYVPALAWTAFAFAGWLLGTAGKRFDNVSRPV